MEGKLKLPGISEAAVQELAEFAGKVRDLARADLAAHIKSYHQRTRLPDSGALGEVAGEHIVEGLGYEGGDWFAKEHRLIRRGQLRYQHGAITQIRRTAGKYKMEATTFVKRMRMLNEQEIKLLRQQRDLSFGDPEGMDVSTEEKRRYREEYRLRIAGRQAIDRALQLGLSDVYGRINKEAGVVENEARQAERKSVFFRGSMRLAQFTSQMVESVGGLAAALVGGGTSAFFHTAGRATGLVIEAGGEVAATAVHQGAIGGSKLLGLVVGAAISKISGDPSMVRRGMEAGGKVGDVLGELAATGIRGIASTLGGMMGPYGALIGAGLEAGTKSWAVYDIEKQKLTAMGSGGSLDTARSKGYVSEQARVAATGYLSAIGDDRMFGEFLSIGRMYGVAPTDLSQTLDLYKFSGGTRPGSTVDLKMLYRRAARLTQQPGMGGYGRTREVFQASSKLAEAVGTQVDALTEEDMTALIGTQAWIGQLGEGYGGLRGLEVLSKLNQAIRGEGGIVARALGVAEVDSAESYIEYQKRKEKGLGDTNNLHRLISQVVKEWGTGAEAIGTLREVADLRTVQARNIIGLVAEKGIESLTSEELQKLAKPDDPRQEMIGAGERFAVEFENMEIKMGAAGHELVWAIKEANANMALYLAKVLSGEEEGLDELMNEIVKYMTLFWRVLNAFFGMLESMLGIDLESWLKEEERWHSAYLDVRLKEIDSGEAFDKISDLANNSGARVGKISRGTQRNPNALQMYFAVHPEDIHVLAMAVCAAVDELSRMAIQRVAWRRGIAYARIHEFTYSVYNARMQTQESKSIFSWSVDESLRGAEYQQLMESTAYREHMNNMLIFETR